MEGAKEGATEPLIVRDFFSGDPVVSITTQKNESVWQPGYGASSLSAGKEISTSTTFKLDGRPETGKPLEFGSKYYKTVEPKFSHLSQRWGGTSVFVQEISADEYKKLTSGPA